MRSHEFPLIHLYIDVGIESKSILPFCSFHIVSSYGACSQIDEIDGSLQNEMKLYHNIVNQPLDKGCVITVPGAVHVMELANQIHDALKCYI